MYLLRTIQAGEKTWWVDQLGVDSKCSLPLPIVPRRKFSKVVVIHRGRALCFELGHIEYVDENAVVGSDGSNVIKAKVRLHVKTAKPLIGTAKITGFQGIRYRTDLSDVVDDLR